MKIKGSVCGLMTGILLAILLAFTPTAALAQISFGVQIGGPPVTGPPPACQWGYYDYPPYACAPRTYWGPEYFYNGIFLGVGPWFGWGYHHGWGSHRFHGYYRWRGHEWGRSRWDRGRRGEWRNDHQRGEWQEHGHWRH